MSALALGWVRLAAVVAPLVAAAIGVQRRLIPDADAAEAALARTIVAIALALAVAEVVGSVGQFRPVVILVAEALVGTVVAALTGVFRRRRPPVDRPAAGSGERGPGTAGRVAIGLALLVLATCVISTVVIGRRGVLDNDSLRYHGPFVARWLQTHSLTALNHTSGKLQETFFPANTELLSAVGTALAGSDWLVPALNIGWLALALLAGWTMVDRDRRPYGLLAVAMVAGTPLLISWQPGSARNDVAAAALVLASLAILRRVHGRLGVLALSGAAAGLAFGSKLSILAPFVVIAIGVPLLAARGARVRSSATWLLAAFTTGNFWYLRNWVRTGNPLPWYRLHLGPIRLPAPSFPFEAVEGKSIADYVGSGHFWTETVPAGLTKAAGRAWPLLLVVCAAGIVLAIRSRRPFHVLVGAAAAVAVAADVVTPYTAGGLGGPTLFPTQLRFLTLAAMLALLGGVLGAERRWLWLLPTCAAPLFVVGSLNLPGRAWVVAVALAAVGLVVLAARRPWSATSARRVAVGACVIALLAAVPAVHWYDEHRYAADHPTGAEAAYAYFRDVHHARVAVNAAMHTYPLSGTDLTNYAQTVGSPIRHGGFRVADTCATWQRLLRDGRYTYVVTGFAHHHTGTPPREQGWTERFPGAQVVMRSGTTTVFRIDGRDRLDRRPTAVGCPG